MDEFHDLAPLRLKYSSLEFLLTKILTLSGFPLVILFLTATFEIIKWCKLFLPYY